MPEVKPFLPDKLTISSQRNILAPSSSLILHLSTLGEACVAIYSSGVFLLRGRVLGRMGEAVKWKASRIWLARKRPDEDKYGVYNRRCRPWWDETNAGILPAPASKLAGDPVRCAQDDNFEGSAMPSGS